ncbi:HNH endonuclease [Bradyrhizobium quebecense]|uniref:HNH endonuclease n=1 Tax=Bradyrhizobium quebecense TaxID=2748629 RepID=A0A973WMM2_9BRAD
MKASPSYIEERSIPEPNSGCWLWLLSIGSHGYGQAACDEAITPRNRAGVTTAPRASYIAYKGPIPSGLHIDHLCRNRVCVNPEHLEAVTSEENMKRAAVARGRLRHDNETPEEAKAARAKYVRGWYLQKRLATYGY